MINAAGALVVHSTIGQQFIAHIEAYSDALFTLGEGVCEDDHIPDTGGVTLWYLMCRVGG